MRLYDFRCDVCNKVEEKQIELKNYEKEVREATCSCGGKQKRVILQAPAVNPGCLRPGCVTTN